MIARDLATAILGRIRVGQLTVIEGDSETVFGSGAPQATVHVHDPSVWPQILRGGPEDGLAVVLDHRQLADVDPGEDAHGDLAGGVLDHRAGWGWTGTPLSFSATAWP